jgi:hypothetical protein
MSDFRNLMKVPDCCILWRFPVLVPWCEAEAENSESENEFWIKGASKRMCRCAVVVKNSQVGAVAKAAAFASTVYTRHIVDTKIELKL